MGRQGLVFRDPPKAAYETIWCGWGYEKNFTLPEFYGTFPMVRKLGIDWIVLDYGWDTGVGDYHLDPGKFPNGDADMKKLVADIHAVGAKAKLWWMPLSVHPCTDMFQNHTEYLLRNADGSPVFIEFWKSFFLCPASDDVRRLTREFVIKAIRDWGWDGLKIDGNNLNSVPPCFNPDHKHAYPEESVEKLPEFFKMIYETTLSIKPDAVIEICPCGTNYSFFILPYMNQAVASDPTNSWQIRQKGKTLKALSASKVAYYGDHVELSDAGSDFASIARPIGEYRYDARGEDTVVFDLQQYLAALGPNSPIRSIADLVKLTGQDPFSRDGLFGYLQDYPDFVASLAAPSEPPDLRDFVSARERYLVTFSDVMDRHRLDALVFPQSIAEPPLLHSKEFSEHTTVSQINIGGFPAIIVPAGAYPAGTPFAAIFIGRLWDEARLLGIAFAYEQQTRMRRAPELVVNPVELSRSGQ
jgi:hypothetical protein